MGYGVINGRGGDLLLINGVPGPLSWWGLTLSCYFPLGSNTAVNLQNNPMMIQANSSSNFTLYKTSVINGPYINIRFEGGNGATPTTGFTAWDVKVIDSATVANTDAIDPVDYTSNVTVANSWLSTGDDGHGNRVAAARQTAYEHEHHKRSYLRR